MSAVFGDRNRSHVSLIIQRAPNTSLPEIVDAVLMTLMHVCNMTSHDDRAPESSGNKTHLDGMTPLTVLTFYQLFVELSEIL